MGFVAHFEGVQLEGAGQKGTLGNIGTCSDGDNGSLRGRFSSAFSRSLQVRVETVRCEIPAPLSSRLFSLSARTFRCESLENDAKVLSFSCIDNECDFRGTCYASTIPRRRSSYRGERRQCVLNFESFHGAAGPQLLSKGRKRTRAFFFPPSVCEFCLLSGASASRSPACEVILARLGNGRRSAGAPVPLFAEN